MRKNWKIIIGIVFLIGGFGCVGSDMGAAAFGVLVGVALISWWCLGLRKASAKNSTAIKETPCPVSSPTQPKVPYADLTDSQLVTQISPRSEKGKEGFDVIIPEKKDGAPLAYRYSVTFVPSDLDAVLAVAKAERWFLSAKQIGKEIHLFSDGTDLGVLTERADMVSDWLRRNEPYLVVLERVNSETGCTVMLVFYRDKQKYYADKEQTIVALTGFKAAAKQDVLNCIGEGDELELEEDLDNEDSVIVSYVGDPIGRLPQKYAQRYISDGVSLIVLDRVEEDDEMIQKPYVRIYW